MESVKPIQKRIFQEDGFDIDLSYVIDNLIAMGYLSESIVSMYLTMPCQSLVKSPPSVKMCRPGSVRNRLTKFISTGPHSKLKFQLHS